MDRWSSRAPLAALGFSLLAGCYAHSSSQAYRGAFSGKIVDDEGRPVAGAMVVACTSERSKAFDGCPLRAEAWTDADGRFQFWPVKSSDGCCAADAPPPATHVTVCGRGAAGQLLLASSVAVDASGASEPRIAVAPTADPSARSACVAPK